MKFGFVYFVHSLIIVYSSTQFGIPKLYEREVYNVN